MMEKGKPFQWLILPGQVGVPVARHETSTLLFRIFGGPPDMRRSRKQKNNDDTFNSSKNPHDASHADFTGRKRLLFLFAWSKTLE
jgi:hypothetical protein